ncbi:MAG: mechanosensitive ion channel family protein [Phycisphaerales bacterium]
MMQEAVGVDSAGAGGWWAWLDGRIEGVWVPLGIGVAPLLVVGAGYWVARLVVGRDGSDGKRGWAVRFLSRSHSAFIVLAVVLGVRLSAPSMPLGGGVGEVAARSASLGLILAVAWLAINAVRAAEEIVVSRFDVSVRDNRIARRAHTQAEVFSRLLIALIVVVGVGAMLMTFPAIRQFGATVLASAGIAGLVLGLAARPTVGNLLAGLQIALAEPIRLDDVVIVEGEWGRVEEITATYVVVRIWDERRLVVPLSHFIEKPFQNWTRTTAQLLGTVFVYVDPSTPVGALREELKRIVGSTDLWDGRVAIIQVTDWRERCVELRVLVSACDSPTLWDLRVLVREKLMDFVRERMPGAMVRARALIEEGGGVGVDSGGGSGSDRDRAGLSGGAPVGRVVDDLERAEPLGTRHGEVTAGDGALGAGGGSEGGSGAGADGGGASERGGS